MTESKDDEKVMNELLKRSDKVSETYRAHLRELLRHGWSTLEVQLGEFKVSWTGNMEAFNQVSTFVLMMTKEINEHLEKIQTEEAPYERANNGPNDPAIK